MVAGTGDDTGMLVLEQVAAVNLEIMIWAEEKPDEDKPWKDKALGAKLPRRFLFCFLFPAAAKHRVCKAPAMEAAIYGTRFATTRQPFVCFPQLGSHELINNMDVPTPCAIATITYRLSVSINAKKQDPPTVATLWW